MPRELGDDSAGYRRREEALARGGGPHRFDEMRCEFYVVQTDEERSALGFLPNLDLPPTRFRLHVFGASQPIGAP